MTPIVIVDLETTGLDVFTADPIELAMLHVEVRGDEIVELAHFEALVPCPPIDVWEPGALAMHRASGLAELVDRYGDVDFSGRVPGDLLTVEMRAVMADRRMRQACMVMDRCIVEQRALEWIDGVVRPSNRSGGVLSCGNNVGCFDLPIIRRTMPRLAERFYYRVLDVSSIKVARTALGWGDEPPKVKSHRALADCRASLVELRHYHAEHSWRARGARP